MQTKQESGVAFFSAKSQRVFHKARVSPSIITERVCRRWFAGTHALQVVVSYSSMTKAGVLGIVTARSCGWYIASTWAGGIWKTPGVTARTW